MARTVRADARVELPPERAVELWRDPRRWTTFVEGFQRLERVDPEWPAVGAKVVWASGPGGRGTVTEKVRESGATSFATSVVEERLIGTQSVQFEPDGDGSVVRLSLEYGLASENPFNPVVDLLFIRRALRDMLTRTLRRFAIEAAEEAALRADA